MNIQTLVLGDYQTNCYILELEGRCFVIDPGCEPDTILRTLNGRPVEAILLTHGHFDHVGAVKALMDATGCTLFMHRADHDQPRIFKMLYPLTHFESPVHFYGEEELPFEVLHTPGHTPGSVCLRAGDVLFTGDTLFDGSCGRTDLPGGNHKQILQSLAKLKALDGDLNVPPGHGTATTLDIQRKINPYM